jgi:hypothetical protein
MARGTLFWWCVADIIFIMVTNYWFYVFIRDARNAATPFGLVGENVSGMGLLKSDVMS